MAWIESHQELGRHPKTKKLARILNISVPTAVGHLHFFWWWALDYAQDGSLSRYDAEDVADAVMWDDEPSKFLEAMITAGFIDQDEDGVCYIHDWYEYAGRLIEKRRGEAARKRKARIETGDIQRISAGCPLDVQRTSNGCPQDDPGTLRVTVPNSTLPNSTDKDLTSDPEAPTQDTRAKSTAKQRVFAEDSVEFALARRLRERILENLPTAKVPNTPTGLQGWCREFDLMLRVDKRDPPEIEALIDWCQSDPFWRSNIMSPKKLREKYDQLVLKREEQQERRLKDGRSGPTQESTRRRGKWDEFVINSR